MTYLKRGFSQVLLLLLFALLLSPAFSERYKTPVFNNAEETSDINYGSHNQLLDLYKPKGDTETNRPAIIFIHGGSFMYGSKEGLSSAAILFARMGYVTASINYRLCPSNTGVTYGNLAQHRNCLNLAREDSEASIKWMKENAKAHGVDPKNVFVVGSSAGALTAIYLGELPRSPSSPLPTGVASCMGAMILSDVQSAISNGPPVAFFHGSDDTTVPIAAAKQTRNGLALKETVTEFNEYPNTGHSINPGSASVSAKLSDFIFRNLVPSSPETTTTTTVEPTTTTTVAPATTTTLETTTTSVVSTSTEPSSTSSLPTTTAPICSCTPFSNASCSLEKCPPGFIAQERVCTPENCATHETCVYYPSACNASETTTSFPIPSSTIATTSAQSSVSTSTSTSTPAENCSCSDFSNFSCAEAGCPLGYLFQNRTCEPSGCARESACAYSTNCPLSLTTLHPAEKIPATTMAFSTLPTSSTISPSGVSTTTVPIVSSSIGQFPEPSPPKGPKNIFPENSRPPFSTDPLSPEKPTSSLPQENSVQSGNFTVQAPLVPRQAMIIGASALGALVAVGAFVGIFILRIGK